MLILILTHRYSYRFQRPFQISNTKKVAIACAATLDIEVEAKMKEQAIFALYKKYPSIINYK